MAHEEESSKSRPIRCVVEGSDGSPRYGEQMVTSSPEVVHFLELAEQAFAHVSHTPSVETGVPAIVALRKQLEQTRVQLRCALDETSRRLEWHHLNIAFYGETNAGKSTLVETLGILLDEPTRRARSAAFRRGESPEINANGVSQDSVAEFNPADCL